MNLYECDPTAIFDDNNLPDDLCDSIPDKIRLCSSNFATVWAVGGDVVSRISTYDFCLIVSLRRENFPKTLPILLEEILKQNTI